MVNGAVIRSHKAVCVYVLMKKKENTVPGATASEKDSAAGSGQLDRCRLPKNTTSELIGSGANSSRLAALGNLTARTCVLPYLIDTSHD